jgi:hypothetical protein
MKTILFICFLGHSYGFTPIRSIVTTQAFTESFINNINQEFVTDGGVVKDIFQYHLHPELDIVYTVVFMGTAYLQYNMFIDKKNWDNVELYQKSRRAFNAFLTIIFIIFIRNIDNAI